MAAVQVVEGAASYGQEKANAKAMQRYYGDIYSRNRTLAIDSANRQYADLNTREIQENAAASGAANEVMMRARAARATARAAAADSGAAGNSVDALDNEFVRQESASLVNIRRNRLFGRLQAISAGFAIKTNAEAQILSALPRPVTSPSFANAAFKIGGDLVGTYAGYKDSNYA